MKTNHVIHAGIINERPEELPLLTVEDFVKGFYNKGDKFCYTGWLLHIFIPNVDGANDFVGAYREFRLATMDEMYQAVDKDRCDTPQERCAAFNRVAQRLGYKQIETKEWLNKYSPWVLTNN